MSARQPNRRGVHDPVVCVVRTRPAAVLGPTVRLGSPRSTAGPGETLRPVRLCFPPVNRCVLCSSSDDSNDSARDAATTGAALGARLGSRGGPLSTGLGAGFGAAAGYLAGNAVGETVGRLVPDGGRDQTTAPRDADADPGVGIEVEVEVEVREADGASR